MTARQWIKQHRLRVLGLGLACLIVYAAVPVLILAFGLDGLVLSPSEPEATHEARQYIVASDEGRGIAIRRYGEAHDGQCVIFFPGQHGGMARYEHDLLPMLRVENYSLYTLSYPGQDGAPGSASLSQLDEDVDRALRFLADARLCSMRSSLFVGRSFGASVAVLEAAEFHPKGVLVEGVSPDLATAIRAWMRRHVMTWPWQWLPIGALVPAPGDLKPVVADWKGTPMIVFQGTADDVTPFHAARTLMLNRPGVRFEAVPGGDHENTFLMAAPAYRAALVELSGR
jgi:alpha-beta hydrolase superfamily lysophospholipase